MSPRGITERRSAARRAHRLSSNKDRDARPIRWSGWLGGAAGPPSRPLYVRPRELGTNGTNDLHDPLLSEGAPPRNPHATCLLLAALAVESPQLVQQSEPQQHDERRAMVGLRWRDVRPMPQPPVPVAEVQ